MRGSKGYRAGTRHLLTKGVREKGKIRVSKLLREYEPGSRVVIKTDPAMQKGMPHRRFYGHTGTIILKRGRSYVVDVSQGDSMKRIIVRPEHLEPAGGD